MNSRPFLLSSLHIKLSSYSLDKINFLIINIAFKIKNALQKNKSITRKISSLSIWLKFLSKPGSNTPTPAAGCLRVYRRHKRRRTHLRTFGISPRSTASRNFFSSSSRGCGNPSGTQNPPTVLGAAGLLLPDDTWHILNTRDGGRRDR